MCLGHESSGVIVKLGPDVTKTRRLELGQRVALEPGVVCRVCEFCKAGQYEVSLFIHCLGGWGWAQSWHERNVWGGGYDGE